jgi:hypothetical protein
MIERGAREVEMVAKPAKATPQAPTAGKAAPNLTQIAAHLGLSRAGVRELELAGIIDRNGGIDGCRLAYIRHLRDRNSGRSQADAELRKAKAREIQQRIEERDRKSIDIDDSLGCLELVVGLVLTELAGQPARCTRDPTMRRALERDIYQMRLRLVAALGQACEALRTGKDLDKMLVHGFGSLLASNAGGDGDEQQPHP